MTFQIMLEMLLAQATVLGCLETRQSGEEVPGTSPHSLLWVHRADESAVQSSVLLNAVKSLELPASPGVAYLAGEARTVQALHHYFIGELHWPRTAIRTKAYWTPGKADLD